MSARPGVMKAIANFYGVDSEFTRVSGNQKGLYSVTSLDCQKMTFTKPNSFSFVDKCL